MSGRKKDRGLGRGLSALMSDLNAADARADVDDADDAALETKSALPTGTGLVDDRKTSDAPREQPGTMNVAISRLTRNPDQPRVHFDRNKMDDLIASIQQKGVLQPILVRELIDGTGKAMGRYQIVAGERRWQAALKAGLTSVPIIIRQLSDRDVLEIGVIENVQRADLNPMEEAMAYEKLSREFGRTQAEIATTIGKSRAHVANTIRLTGLSERARQLLLEGKLTAGHARAVLAAKDPDALAEAIVTHDWSVRQAEAWVKSDGESPARQLRKKAAKPSDITALEQRIRDRTGFETDIRHQGKGGEIRIKYKDLPDMEDLLRRLDAQGK